MEKVKLTRSSGNVFRDLGFSGDEAEYLKVRADLMVNLQKVITARGLILEGPIAPTASPTLLELTHRLSRRYLGPDGPRYTEHTIQRPRVLVRLEPVSWTTWTGREWHPRYR